MNVLFLMGLLILSGAVYAQNTLTLTVFQQRVPHPQTSGETPTIIAIPHHAIDISKPSAASEFVHALAISSRDNHLAKVLSAQGHSVLYQLRFYQAALPGLSQIPIYFCQPPYYSQGGVLLESPEPVDSFCHLGGFIRWGTQAGKHTIHLNLYIREPQTIADGYTWLAEYRLKGVQSITEKQLAYFDSPYYGALIGLDHEE